MSSQGLEKYLRPRWSWESFKATLALRAFSFFKVPLLFFVSPRVVELNENRCVIQIPLLRRNRNHLKSMYFGVLACGADAAGGLLAMLLGQKGTPKVSLVFKDFQASFLKRPEGDVLFICDDGVRVKSAVQQAQKTGERVNISVKVTAICPSFSVSEPVADFALTLSLKAKA